jgi:tripartite-type tricarboxylate transporter receptor subunit TctC
MKRILPFGVVMVLVAGFIFNICPPPVAEAASAADFYKKNVVTAVVGYTPGGGSDYAARLLASYWSAATDGGAMVIRNMPGAAGLMATNYMYSAKPDGLTIAVGMALSSYAMPMITKDPAAKFDAKKLNWLVGVFEEPWSLHVSVKRPYESLEDLKKAKGLKFGTVSPSASSSFVDAAFIDILGLDARIISGYKGGAAMSLAGGKGEIDVIPQPASTGLRGVEKGFLKPPIVIMGRKRVSFYPNTPTFPEAVKLTPEQEALFKVANTAIYVLRVAAAPPGVPKDRVTFMCDAFAKVVAMEGFLQQAKLQFPLGPTPLIGDELTALMNEAVTIDLGPLEALIKKYLAIK